MSTLSPSTPMAHARNRLRQSIVESSFMSDSDLLTVLNEGYADAVQRSRCSITYTSIPLVVDQVEYSLPSDWAATIRVYGNGIELRHMPNRDALFSFGQTNGLEWYYTYGQTIGFNPPPATGADAAVILYAQTPQPADYTTDPLIQGFTPEYHHLLRHYAAWQCLSLSGGADRAKQAAQERAFYDLGCEQLAAATKKLGRHVGVPVQTPLMRPPQSAWRDPSVA